MEHGITTTKAEFWLHLLIPMRRLYRYSVRDCLDHIERSGLQLVGGKSKDKDRTVTGRGYLVSCDAPWIKSMAVPDSYFTGYDFTSMNDRKLGLLGQIIITSFVANKGNEVKHVNTRKAQIEDAYDCVINGALTELKTENKDTGNLFVQRYEGGHMPLEGGEAMAMPAMDPDALTNEDTRKGFVGYNSKGMFLHYCHCGKWAGHGVGVHLLKDQLGKWYCDEHKPKETDNGGTKPAIEPAAGPAATTEARSGEGGDGRGGQAHGGQGRLGL